MNIPVTFEWKGKEYKGVLSKVAGSGGNAIWHLSIDGFYYGQLHYTDNYGYTFHTNLKNMFGDMGPEFGRQLESYQP